MEILSWLLDLAGMGSGLLRVRDVEQSPLTSGPWSMERGVNLTAENESFREENSGYLGTATTYKRSFRRPLPAGRGTDPSPRSTRSGRR